MDPVTGRGCGIETGHQPVLEQARIEAENRLPMASQRQAFGQAAIARYPSLSSMGTRLEWYGGYSNSTRSIFDFVD
jgi:hypothetical protein